MNSGHIIVCIIFYIYSDKDHDSQMFLYPVFFFGVDVCVSMNISNDTLRVVWFGFTTRWMEWSDSAGAMMMVVVVAIVVSEMNV